MNKTELITAVAQEAEMTKKDAEKAVKAVLDRLSLKATKYSSSASAPSKSVSAKPA